MTFDYTTLITDRTQSDVDRVKYLAQRLKNGTVTDEERAEYLTDLKGAYNATDLNRITEAMVYLKELYEQYGHTVTYTPVYITHTDGTTDTTWKREDIPTEKQMSLVIQNLHNFWVDVENAAGDVTAIWADTGFGYVEMSAEVTAGDYISMTAAHGIRELRITARSERLSGIRASGTGWAVQMADSTITAVYTVPQGAFQDIQEALNGLTFLCSSADYVDTAVEISALMRSGAEIQIGNGAIHWSAIINWAAFESYAYTWQAVEDAQMTWDDLERLPIPEIGGNT